MQQILNNIRKVEVIDAFHLRHSDYVNGRGIFINVIQVFKDIPLIGFAEATVNDEMEGNQRIFTIELTFRTCSPLLPNGRKLCFMVTTVSGESYLLGTHFGPYPVVMNKQIFPGSMVNSSANTVKVEYKGAYPLMKVLD